MAASLSFLDQRFVNFRNFAFAEPSDHAYRWVDVKRFRFDADAGGDGELLAALTRQAPALQPE